MGEVRIGVARGDGLALLGQPEAPAHRPRRLGADGAAGRPAAARHGAAPAVEQGQGHAVLAAHAARSTPGPGRAPSSRPGSRRPCCCRSSRSSPSARPRSPPDARGSASRAKRSARMRGAASRSSSVSKSGTIWRPDAHPAQRASSSDREHVGRPARHRDDERTEQGAPVHALRAGQEAEEPPDLRAGLARRRGGRGQVGRLRGLVGQQAQQPARCGPGRRAGRSRHRSRGPPRMPPSATASRPASSRMSRRAAWSPKVSELGAHVAQLVLGQRARAWPRRRGPGPP